MAGTVVFESKERDEDGITPIHVALDINIIKYFLEPCPSGLNIDPNICANTGETPLHYAVLYNQIEVVKYLINEKKCDPMHGDNDGTTCPHFAAMGGALDALKFVYEMGCNMTTNDKLSFTPLCHAIKFRHVSAVEYLLDVCKC